MKKDQITTLLAFYYFSIFQHGINIPFYMYYCSLTKSKNFKDFQMTANMMNF